jgi:single-strand DNA-binding protein
MIIVEIAGFLGADAEERFTASGKRVVSLRVATKVRQSGADETVWWKVNVWNDRYDKMLPYLKKGSPVIIIGEMSKPETYTTKDGSTAVSMSMTAEMIKFSPFGKPDQKDSAHSHDDMAMSGASSYASYGAAEPVGMSIGDDLPF